MRHIALMLICACLLAGRLEAEDWSSWRGPRGDGTWNAPKLPERWPEAGLKRVWRQSVGGGYAGIAVSDGRVFTLDRAMTLDKASDGAERVVCFDAQNGTLLWEHHYAAHYGKLGGYSNGPRAMPTVLDGFVYTLGAVGHVHCLEAKSGKLVWGRDLIQDKRSRIPEWGCAASPVVDGERIIFHVAVSTGGCLVALDRRTGKEIWNALPDRAGYCTPILIKAPSGRQLVAWTPENVRGLDPATGKVLWTVPYAVTYGVSIATPIFHDGLVFVTGYWEGAKAVRLGPGPMDAQLAWEDADELRGFMSQPLYRHGLVFSFDHRAGLVCFELKTGKRLWADYRLTTKGRNPHATLVWLNSGDRAIILNARGELILARLARDDYHEQSRIQLLEGGVWSHPAFTSNRLFARTDGGERPTAAGPYELACFEFPGAH